LVTVDDRVGAYTETAVIIPRIGALCVLIAYGFAAASIARLMYVVASEGYSSWVGAILFILPAAVLGLASALLVLMRKPLGVRLALPFVIVLFVTAAMTFLKLPPVGGFLDDYERAALARGVDVPAFEEARGTTPQEWVEKETGDVRSQGAVGAIVLIIIYTATVLRGSRSRKPSPAAAPRTST
jgi:hypothetical protein